MLAVRPDLVHADRYSGDGMTTQRPEAWAAWPFPSSIVRYRPSEGKPAFDRTRARRYFDGMVDRPVHVIDDVVAKWERAGL